jgi:hypothetical protein
VPIQKKKIVYQFNLPITVHPKLMYKWKGNGHGWGASKDQMAYYKGLESFMALWLLG